MESGLSFIVLLCLSCGLCAGANAQANEQLEDDCCKTCPPGWTQFGDHCYIFEFTQKDWADAEVACVAIDGNLASVHTKEEYTFIKDMIKRSTGADPETWIGGEDATKEGVWLWIDGTKFDFKLWPAGEPNNAGGAENCLELNYNGNPNDKNCNEKKSFVCGKHL